MSDAMNFDQLVEFCRLTHEEIQKQAVRAVDHTLVVRNWLFGRYIVEYEQNGADRAAYGAGLMDALTSRLKPLGIKGISATRLRLYRSFYREYGPIQPTLAGELAKPELSTKPVQFDGFGNDRLRCWSAAPISKPLEFDRIKTQAGKEGQP